MFIVNASSKPSTGLQIHNKPRTAQECQQEAEHEDFKHGGLRPAVHGPKTTIPPVPMRAGSNKAVDIGAAMAACLADEQRLQIGQPDLIGASGPR